MKRYLKILLAPLSALLSALIWLCAGALSISAWIFRLASILVTVIGLAVLSTYSVKNGVILLVIAILISPMGLPMLAVRALGLLQSVSSELKGYQENG